MASLLYTDVQVIHNKIAVVCTGNIKENCLSTHVLNAQNVLPVQNGTMPIAQSSEIDIHLVHYST